MRKITKDELKDILDKHKAWLNGKPDGVKADLSYADLSYADLRSADLSYADLRSADLSYADLRYADLRYADLRSADLSYADLSYADLRSADLSYADLRYADLRSIKIERELVDKFFPLACPESGSFIGWKACRDGLIVKLEICEDAKRSSAFGRKCRCSAAKVLAIYDEDEEECAAAISINDSDFVYRVGEIVRVDNFEDDRTQECAPGIHFFITRKEAEDYK